MYEFSPGFTAEGRRTGVITTTHRSGFLPALTRMTLNDFECPIQLKLRMSHGLLADSVDTSLASLLYSCTTDAVFSEVHDQ